jgi:hypothetical protein
LFEDVTLENVLQQLANDLHHPLYSSTTPLWNKRVLGKETHSLQRSEAIK